MVPEVAKLLRELVAHAAVAAWAFLIEQLAHLDAENLLVLPHRALAVDDVEHLPAHVMADA
jgi:hypothetical protein